MSFISSITRLLSRRNIFIASIVLVLAFCSAWLLVDESIVSFDDSHFIKFNRTAIET